MKKIIAIASMMLAVSPAFAAATAVATTSAPANAQCAYIPSTAGTVQLTTSANVAAAYECTSTGVVTGAAHMQGKKHGYVSTSSGGTQQQVTLTANPTATTDTTGLTGAAEWTNAVAALS